MKRTFSCRVCCILLSILVGGAALLSRPAALNASAAAVAIGDAALNEMSMVLWNLLMNSLVACGVSAAVPDGETAAGTISTPIGDYDVEAALYEALLDSYEISSVSDDMVFTLQNGRAVTLKELLELTRWDTAGTGARRIPSEETWQRFRVIQGGGSGSTPPSPDDGALFTALVSVAVSTAALGGIAAFVNDLREGNVEGLEASDYFPEGFDGTLPRDAEGNYIGTAHMVLANHQPNFQVSSGGIWPTYTYYDNYIHRVYDVDFSYSAPFVLYLEENTSFWGSSAHSYSVFQIKVLCNDSNKVLGTYSFSDRYSYNGSVSTGSGSLVSGTALVSFNHHDFWTAAEADDIAKIKWALDYKSTNLPIFSSREAAQLYLDTGDFSGCENALQYDPAALPDALPDNFAPLTGKELDPSVFNALFPALVSALQTAFPQPQPTPDAEPEPVPLPDPVAGTGIFNQVVTDTATDVAAGTASKPDPAPQPDIDIGSYKADLTNIFPFCLPFDFIHLIQALAAEPVTPCFDFPFVVPALDMDITVKIDLSMFDDFMQVFRLCETVSFIVLLIFLTPKMIRW